MHAEKKQLRQSLAKVFTLTELIYIFSDLSRRALQFIEILCDRSTEMVHNCEVEGR